VWVAVSSLLTDAVSLRLRQDLHSMIEQEREIHGGPDAEARAWTAKLAETDRKRDKY